MRALHAIGLLCAILTLPTACSAVSSNESPAQKKHNSQEKIEGITVNKPLIVPPGIDNISINQDSNSAETLPNGFKGLNIDTLFAEKLDDDDRFDRLEQAFIDFRKEYEKITPAILRLTAVEADMQNLIDELGTFVDEEQGDTTLPSFQQDGVLVEPLSPKEESTPPQAPTPPQKVLVKNIRTGIHPDKVRIVLDINNKATYKVALNNDTKILTIKLEEAELHNDLTKETSFSAYSLLDSYSTNDAETLDIIFKINKSSEILQQSIISPQNKNGDHKIVIDLKN